MPAYDILYLDSDGAPLHSFTADCSDEGRARVLAHAMKLPSVPRLEVWRDGALVYARPAPVQPQLRIA